MPPVLPDDATFKYGEADLEKMAQVLERPLSAEVHRDLQRGAVMFLIGRQFEHAAKAGRGAQLPKRGERRRRLNKFADRARGLLESYYELVGLWPNENEQLGLSFPDGTLISRLSLWEAAARRVAANIPGGGADPGMARSMFVGKLADIYEQVTGKRATRQFDIHTDLDSGPFLEFTKAAIRPLDPSALKGLEHVVRREAEKRKSLT